MAVCFDDSATFFRFGCVFVWGVWVKEDRMCALVGKQQRIDTE